MDGNSNEKLKDEVSASHTANDTYNAAENTEASVSSPELAGMLGNLLGNAELMSMIRKIADSSTNSTGTALKEESPSPNSSSEARPTSAQPTSSGLPDIGSLLSSPELMSKLPEVLEAIKPLVNTGKPHSDAPDKRLALLCALKPYMSEHRREAIDYITKINKLGGLFNNLKL